MTENELAEKNAQFAKGVMELAFRMGYVTRDDEIVRCKDCKYRDEQSANCTRFRKDWYVQSNSFCSWAEREEE